MATEQGTTASEPINQEFGRRLSQLPPLSNPSLATTVYGIDGVEFGRFTMGQVIGESQGSYTLNGFGFVPGMSDATTVVQAALNYIGAVGGGTLLITPEMGVVNVSTVSPFGNTLITGGGTIRAVGNNQAVINVSGTVEAPALPLSADATDKTITLSDASRFAAGDYLILSDTVSYTPTDAGYRNGQMLRVASVSGGVITVEGRISRTMDGSFYTVANSAAVRRVVPLDPVAVENITFAGNFDSTSQLILMSWVKSPRVIGCRTEGHGNTAFRFHGCISGIMRDNDISSLRMDLANGRPGYACVLSGPDRDSRISGNRWEKVRHGFTTMGSSLGYPRGSIISDNIDSASLLTGVDTHAAGMDMLICDNTVLDSGGNGIVVRSPQTVVQNNLVVRSAATGILLAESNLRDVTVTGNKIVDCLANAMDCPPSCPNLIVEDNVITRAGGRGIRVFGSAPAASPGLKIMNNTVSGFCLIAAGLYGIETAGTVASTGGIIRGNVVDEGAGNAAVAIRTRVMTADVSENLAKGSFSTTAFDIEANVSTNNRAIA